MKSAEEFLKDIDVEIEKKCMEIKEKRKEKRLNILFLICCNFILVIPVVMICSGIQIVNVLLAFLIIGIIGLAIFAITKILGGKRYEEIVKC